MREADGLSFEIRSVQWRWRSSRHPDGGADAAFTRDGLLANPRAVSKKRRRAAPAKEAMVRFVFE